MGNIPKVLTPLPPPIIRMEWPKMYEEKKPLNQIYSSFCLEYFWAFVLWWEKKFKVNL